MTDSTTCVDGRTTDTHPLAPVVSAGVTAGTLAVAFGLLAVGFESFWVAFVVGFGGVLPVALGVLATRGDDRERLQSPDTRSDAEAALDTLRARYARGDLTDAEFERRVERLLETESPSEDTVALDWEWSPATDRGRDSHVPDSGR